MITYPQSDDDCRFAYRLGRYLLYHAGETYPAEFQGFFFPPICRDAISIGLDRVTYPTAAGSGDFPLIGVESLIRQMKDDLQAFTLRKQPRGSLQYSPP